MKKINTLKSILTAAFVVGTFCVSAYAQDYDDDLYFSPSKAKKEQAAKAAAAKKAAQEQAARQQQVYQYNYTTEDFPAAGSYSVSSTRPLNVDVDTYNRRGSYSSSGSQSSEPEMTDFANTRRIERFHNSDVVVNTGDTALMEYYYSQPAQQDINITIVNEVSPWSSAWNWNTPSSWWRWRYASPSWAWNWAFDPWFDFGWSFGPGWGPSWSWSWNWGPSWSWGWNWGPSWGWGGPGWGPSWGWGGPGWGPGHHPAPPVWGYNRPGVTRPHAPATGNGMGSSRPHNNYNNSIAPGGYTRPGNMGRPTYGTTGNQQSGSAVRPAQNGNSQGGTYAPSNNSQRGRNNSGTSTTTRPQNSQSNNQNYNNNSSNRNSNSNNSSWSRPGNSGRSTGGSFGGGSYGGGSRSTGGGGGASRGRGR